MSGAIWSAHAFCPRFLNETEDCDVLQTADDSVDDPQAREVLTRATKAVRELREYLEASYEFGGNGQAELKAEG